MPYIIQKRRDLYTGGKWTGDDFKAGDLSYILMTLTITKDPDVVLTKGMDFIEDFITQFNILSWSSLSEVYKSTRSAIAMLKVKGYCSITWDTIQKLEHEFEKKYLIPYELSKEEENGSIC